MELKDLKYFRTIAQCGTFSKAAAHLRVAQPALSRKIQKLEHNLGLQLLRRTARGVSPTEAGQILLQRAIAFEHELDEIRHEMARYAERATGTVRVAVQSPLSQLIVTDLVRAYQASHPGVTLELSEGFSGDLIDGLLNERFDLALADTPSHPHADLTYDQLWIEALHLVGPAGGEIGRRFGRGPVALPDLADLPVIMPGQRHGIRRLVDAAFERQHMRFRPVLEVNGAHMILQLVRSGFGYTLLSNHIIYQPIASGEVEAVSVRPMIRRTMSVITRTALLDDSRVAPLRQIVMDLAPGLAKQKQFGPAALYCGTAMPDGHGPKPAPALAAARLNA